MKSKTKSANYATSKAVKLAQSLRWRRRGQDVLAKVVQLLVDRHRYRIDNGLKPVITVRRDRVAAQLNISPDQVKDALATLRRARVYGITYLGQIRHKRAGLPLSAKYDCSQLAQVFAPLPKMSGSALLALGIQPNMPPATDEAPAKRRDNRPPIDKAPEVNIITPPPPEVQTPATGWSMTDDRYLEIQAALASIKGQKVFPRQVLRFGHWREYQQAGLDIHGHPIPAETLYSVFRLPVHAIQDLLERIVDIPAERIRASFTTQTDPNETWTNL